MSRFQLSRRTLIRGAGSIAIALPWLESMGSQGAQAQRATPAQRFLAVFTPGGAMQSPQAGSQRYWPSGTETQPILSPILTPLQPVQHKLLTLRGLEMACAIGDQHASGMIAWLGGSEQLPGEGFSALPSIDQVIATRISKGKKARASIQMAIRWETTGSGDAFDPTNVVNFEDNPTAAPIPPSIDPVAIFNDLFGQVVVPEPSPQPSGGADVSLLRSKSILDFVDRKYVALAARLGPADRAKLEQHLEKIREVEKGFSTGFVAGGKCQPPQRVDTSGYNPRGSSTSDLLTPTVGKHMMDMMVMALACDITAVGTLQWTDSHAWNTFPWLALSQHHHFYQHDGGYQPVELEKIGTWYSEQHAYLLQAMDKIDMGGHSLLDESVVYFGTELGWPESHDKNNVPLMLAGGGGLRGGRHLDFRANKADGEDKGIPHNNLLVSILNLFGDSRTSYQEAGKNYCNNPINNLT